MLFSLRDRLPLETRPRIASDRWTVSLSTAHATYPVSKAQTDNLADYARTYGQRRSQTRFRSQTVAVSRAVTIKEVSLLGINRAVPDAAPGAGVSYTANQARLVIDSHLWDTQQPLIHATNFFMTNLSGAYGTLNQPVNPPQETVVGYTPTRLTAVSHTANTQVIAQFENTFAGRNPVGGADQQEFVVHVRDSIDSGIFPIIDVHLASSGGSSITLLAESGVEEDAEGFVFTFPWNADDLTLIGQDVSIKIVGYTTGTSTVEPISVAWRAKRSGLLYESGWADIGQADLVRWLPDHLIPAGETRQILIEFSDLSAITVATALDSLGSPHGVTIHSPAAEAFRVGRFVAGPCIELPTTNDGWVYSPQSNGEAVQMRDGSERFPTTVLSWDEYEIKSQGRTEDLAVDDLLLGLYRAVDVRFPFLVIPHEDDPSHDRWVRFVPNTFELSGGGVKSGGSDPMGRKWNLEARVKEHTARAGVRG